MRKLLLLLLATAFPLTASAQWNFDTVFPSDTLATNANGFGGVAVDDDGTVFLVTHNSTADSITVNGSRRGVLGINIFNPDGSQVAESPLTILDYADGTTPSDTLGYFSFISGTGAIATDTRTGRGIRYCAAENAIYASLYDTIFKIDADSYLGLARVTPFAGQSLTNVGLDDNCNVTAVTVVAGGRSITQYSPDLASTLGTVGTASNFARTILTSPDGNTVFETAFENPYTVVYQRPDEFSAYDSLGITLAGLNVEAANVNPVTGRYWFSSGNPLNGVNDFNDVDPATGDTLRTFYSTQAFYAFEFSDLFDGSGNPVLNPTPVDSLLYQDPGSSPTGGDGVGVGRPRGIAFTADGNTAYVALYNKAGAAQRFTRGEATANEEIGTFSGALAQNSPNPFSGSTEISFELDQASTVALRVYDTTGRQVSVLADGAMAAGPHSVTFQAGGLAAGVYVYVLNVDGAISSRQMMVVR